MCWQAGWRALAAAAATNTFKLWTRCCRCCAAFCGSAASMHQPAHLLAAFLTCARPPAPASPRRPQGPPHCVPQLRLPPDAAVAVRPAGAAHAVQRVRRALQEGPAPQLLAHPRRHGAAAGEPAASDSGVAAGARSPACRAAVTLYGGLGVQLAAREAGALCSA